MSDWTPVRSGRIARFRRHENGDMEVDFHDGGIYTLHDVDERHAKGLAAANSAGRYYDTYLKRHRFTRGAVPR